MELNIIGIFFSRIFSTFKGPVLFVKKKYSLSLTIFFLRLSKTILFFFKKPLIASCFAFVDGPLISSISSFVSFSKLLTKTETLLDEE